MTYFLIEKPFRRNTLGLKKTFLLLSIAYFVLIAFVISSIITRGFDFRVPEELRNKVQRTNYYTTLYKTCHLGLNQKEKTFCSFGEFDKQIILVGDSHAGVLLNDLKAKAEKNNYNFISMTRNAEELNFFDMSEYAQNRYSKLIQYQNSIIVIDGNYNKPGKILDFEKQYSLFRNFLHKMEMNNNHIIFLSPNPHIENPYSSLMNGMRYIRSYKEVGISDFKILKEEYLLSLKKFSGFLKKIMAEFKNVTLLDTSSIFCDGTHCYSIKNGNLLLFDNSHTSDFSARKINSMIIAEAKQVDF